MIHSFHLVRKVGWGFQKSKIERRRITTLESLVGGLEWDGEWLVICKELASDEEIRECAA